MVDWGSEYNIAKQNWNDYSISITIYFPTWFGINSDVMCERDFIYRLKKCNKLSILNKTKLLTKTNYMTWKHENNWLKIIIMFLIEKT